jgi:hypothetical protein
MLSELSGQRAPELLDWTQSDALVKEGALVRGGQQWSSCNLAESGRSPKKQLHFEKKNVEPNAGHESARSEPADILVHKILYRKLIFIYTPMHLYRAGLSTALAKGIC